MNYSRPMIDLVYEIRRRVPSELKPDIKLANPNLLKELTQLVNHNPNIILHALVRELLSLAGEEWIAQLDREDKADDDSVYANSYRGQTLLHKTTSDESHKNEADKPHRPVRIYRGQVIAD